MIPENDNWKEVSKKTQPCPLCDHTDWCYLADNGEAVVCGRTDANKAPLGWRYLKDAIDGRPIFIKEGDKQNVVERKPPSTKANPFPHPNAQGFRSSSPREVRLARLPQIPNDRPQAKPNQVPQWLIDQGIPYHATETRYSYSQSQWVVRYDWENPKNPKGRCKTIRQCHLKGNGKVKWSKGDSQWLPYRFDEALKVSPFANAQNAQKPLTPSPSFANAQGTWVLAVEGEECVETARSLGLVAITWQGSSWTEAEILPPLQRLKDSGFLGIVKFRDNDGEGEEKAKKLESLGSKAGLEVIVLNPTAVWSGMPEKGDIVDWVQWGQAQGMKPEDFIERLEQESQALCTERSVRKATQPQPASKPTGTDRLKLEIQAYLQSPDIFDKVRMKGQICSNYRINSQDFTLLCQALEKQNSTPLPNSFDFSSFMEMGTDALEWIVPGILPKGETVLLAAQAKCGKTLLATDIAYGVLSGGQVLGEQVRVKGRVLLISSDESQNSTRRRLKARGFDLLPESGNLRIMTNLDISDLSSLEKELEDFRPNLVIIDSLTSITRESGLNEKDAEFARPLYKLKDLLGKYGAAGILIHHQNKDKEAKGIDKVSGSARIVAAVWGVWQIIAKDPNNEQDTIRWLKVKPREGEAVTLSLGINPKDTWASAGIFSFIGEFGDETGTKRTQGEKVMELLRKFSPKGLEYQEIDNYLGIGKSLYTVLDRLEDRQMICKRRSEIDQRRWVYCLPEHTTVQDCTIQSEEIDKGYSPPPTHSSSSGEQIAKKLDIIEVKDSQQLFNTESTTIQHPDSVESSQNGYKPDKTINTADQKISQHSPESKGKREVVKPSTANAVVQTPVQRGGGKGEITHTTIPYTSFPNPLFRCEEAVLKVGDRVMDVINSFKGTVVGYRDDRVVFDTYELGRYSRPADLLFKLKYSTTR